MAVNDSKLKGRGKAAKETRKVKNDPGYKSWMDDDDNSWDQWRR